MTIQLTRAEAMILRHALLTWQAKLPFFNPVGPEEVVNRAANFARQAASDIVNRTFAAEDELAPAVPEPEEAANEHLPY